MEGKAMREGLHLGIGINQEGDDENDRHSQGDALSAEFLRVIEVIPEAVITTDEDGAIRFCNSAVLGMFGYTPNELIGRALVTLMPVNLRQAHLQAFGQAVQTGRTKLAGGIVEMTALRKDGREIPVEFSLSAWTSGGKQHFTGILRDISERRRAESALASYTERFKNLVDSTQDGIYWTDAAGGFTFINLAGAEMFGFSSPMEVIGKPARDFWFVPEDRDRFVEELRQNKVLRAYHMPTRRADGSVIDLEVTSRVLEDEAGDFLGIEGILRDGTERRRMEKELKENQEKLLDKHAALNRLFRQVESVKKEWERTMDCAGAMIMLTDMEGKIKRCNHPLSELLGKPFEEILWRDWGELFAEHGMSADTLFEEGIELHHEATGRWFVLRTHPFRDKEGAVEVSGNVITVNEVSETKRMARELENKTREIEEAYAKLKDTQSQILQQEKMASIGQLAAGVAHEINNPMGFISSNLGTLQKYMGRLAEFISHQARLLDAIDLPHGAREELAQKRKQVKLDYILDDTAELIKESLDGADRVKKIVQDLKGFSRVDEAETKTADINAGIESTINIVWNELKYKVTLAREYGDIPMTKCNPGQMNQVFMNMLLNGSHAIEKQGEMKVRTWCTNGSIFVAISDTGCGIPPEKVARIFEPFFTTKEVGKGTGLGLSIAYDIVKKHNGEILVESEVGKGTTFTVRIPVVEGK